MLKRKAMDKRRMEKAQGLILSIKAETPTSGKSHWPPLLKLQRVWAADESVFKNAVKPKRAAAAIISAISFLLIDT